MSKKFKVGDKVYCPMYSTSILTVFRNTARYSSDSHPLEIVVGGDDILTNDGKIINDVIPSIFHATPENHKALEQLYGVEFEKPPVKPTSREIIKATLARGDKYVLCRATNCESYDCYFVLIERVFEDGGYSDSEGAIWDSAEPINPHTGEEITELPE